MFNVTCESICDLTYDYLQSRNCPVLFYTYSIDGEEFEDNMGRDENALAVLYEAMKTKRPTTSQINTEKYADFFREQDFHVHVDVFVGWVEMHLASFDLLENLAKTRHQRGCFLLRDDADIAEHRRVGDGALNVPIIQFLVKADGGMKILHQLVAVL